MFGDNKKVLVIPAFSAATATTELEIKSLVTVDRVEVQIDWSGLTGTLNGIINIFQREESTMQYILPNNNMTKSLTGNSGSYLFSFPNWTASDLKIQILKNNIINGKLNAAVGIRK